MSKIVINIPAEYDRATLATLLRSIADQVNGLSEGRFSALYQAHAAIPTTGTYAVGDFVAKSAPVEAGAGGSKYIIDGWVCTTGGPAGTFVFKERRSLTGN